MQFFYDITQSLNKLWTGTLEVCERKVCIELRKICLPYEILWIILFERKKLLPTLSLNFLPILTSLTLSDVVVCENITVGWCLGWS